MRRCRVAEAVVRIAMTGGTSGIGLVAARAFLRSGAELILGVRDAGTAPPDLGRQARLHPLDLADLESVNRFAEAIEQAGAVEVLVLNAGLQTSSGARSVQGYEITFAVNHLAHYLLARRLAPRLAPGGRVVITASGTHDPALRTGMPPPRHADARRLAHPETDPERDASVGKTGRRAYSSSKLCNVMTARELAARLAPTRPDLAVAAFNPGFTPGTGLARHYPWPAPLLFRHLLPMLARGQGVSTPAISGGCLAALATDPAYADARGDYYSVRGRQLVRAEPSLLARDAAGCARLWEDSAALLPAHLRSSLAASDGDQARTG